MQDNTDVVTNGLNIVLASGDILCQMGPNSSLSLGTCLYSPARGIRLEFQLNDGNAVLKYLETATLPRIWANTPLSGNDPRLHWIPFWSPRTDNHSAKTLIMQPDGNLVVYDGQGIGFWSSQTPNNPGAFLRLQDDGNMFITNQSNQIVWQTNTSVIQSKGANV